MTRMIRSGFLDTASRKELMALVRNAKAESRVTRRANGILLLDDGLSCAQVAKVLYMDDDTIRYWYGQYMSCGIRWLGDFGYKGRACELTTIQQDKLKIWIRETLPRSTSEIDEWIEKTFEVSYTRSGLIKLLGRLDMVYRKPETVPRGLDVAKQKAFIAAYEDLQNNLDPDETVVFVDAVHPTHEGRAAGCWAPKDVKAALLQTSKRDRLNIHGAIDLETGQTRMINVLTVDAQSTISLLSSLEKRYPDKRKISPCADRETLAGQRWLPGHIALCSGVLPTFSSD
ncbi:MAG: IS630 family transposase [Pseudomonadota bacterium]